MLMIDAIAAKSESHDSSIWLPFSIHAFDTAGIIERLFNKWLPDSVRKTLCESIALGSDVESREKMTSEYCRLLALLHDIGKLTPAFQSKISIHILGYAEVLSNEGVDLSSCSTFGSSPHSIAGEAILLNAHFPESFCEIIGSHHGKHCGTAMNQIADYPQNFYGYRKCNQKQWEHLWEAWIHSAFSETDLTLDILPEVDVPSQMILTGLLIMADWLASNPKYFPYISVGCNTDDIPIRLENAWKQIAFTDVWRADTGLTDIQWFDSRFDFEPNDVQQYMIHTVSENPNAGIYILEAPMGVGKTEAALAAAEILAEKFELGGVYFGLPTQATANGLFERIYHWASKCDEEKHSIRLAHGMVDLNEKYQSIFHGTADNSIDESLIVHEWFEGRKQALLSDFVIATVDQFLLASLKQKHIMLRHLGLTGKIVIIDECHAYDAYMNVYLDNTLTWMGTYGVPVIILSATLPPKRREQLIHAYLGLSKHKELTYQTQSSVNAYPVLTWTSQKAVFQSAILTDDLPKEISVRRLPETALVQELGMRLCDGGCAAVIVNTVHYSQFLSRTIAEQLSDFEVICFHSRFLATDRAKIEKMLLSRVGKDSDRISRDRLIVVGTQVMEQSLDLDFDYMVTELCPIDLLLQRSGRLHRHSRKRPKLLQDPILSVLDIDSTKNRIYDKWILYQTEQVLPDKLSIPKCIPPLVSQVYDAADEQDPRYQEYQRTIQKLEKKASEYCIQADNLGKKYKRLLSDFLDDDVGSSKEAEASVRNTEETIEVLVLQKTDNHLLSLANGTGSFDPTMPLDEAEALQIARERLRLPVSLSKWHFGETIRALDVIPEKWRESAWLKGEMLLLLDQDSNAVIQGRTLHYSQIYGLIELERDEI